VHQRVCGDMTEAEARKAAEERRGANFKKNLVDIRAEPTTSACRSPTLPKRWNP
jgi:hypothetical protein